MSNSIPKPNPNRKPPPEVDAVWFTRTTLTFDLSDGRAITVPLTFYTALLTASDALRQEYEINATTVYWSALGLKLRASDLLSGRQRV